MIRSLLFVPGNRPDLMAKAAKSDADALILDLEDAVAPASKPEARRCVAAFLAERGASPQIFVRINPLDRGMVEEDLAAVLGNAPDGLVLPKAESGDCLRRLVDHVKGAPLKFLPIVTETPKAIFGTGTYGDITPGIIGLTWGAEDLSTAVGASRAREDDGRYRPPYELARSLTLFGAHAAGVAAIETVYPSIKDLAGLQAYVSRAREDGFSGMMAIHPTQIAIINAAFRPTEDELSRARHIVELFAANPDVGAFSLDGRMVDAPHLASAKRLLGQAGL